MNCASSPKYTSSLVSTDEWYKHFKNLLFKNESPDELTQTLKLRDQIRELKLNHEAASSECGLNKDISDSEIKSAILSLKNKKSCGLDMVKNEMLKLSMTTCISTINKIFNKILSEGTFPKSWNKGYIVPLHKTGNGRDPNNYRGLTINSCLSKVFTTVLNSRLQKYLQDNDIINKYQIGFLKRSQTSDHMLILKTIADKFKTANEKIYFGFVDFKKAYDTVWRDGLLYKLLANGMNGNFFNVIESMYQTSESYVKVDTVMTESFHNNIGVKQGEVLSPLLFNLYINDLPTSVSDPESPSLNGSPIDCLLCADDLVLMSTSKSGLQRKFDKLGQYCNKWRLCVNTDKTMVMEVSRSGKLPKQSECIIFNNCPLVYTKTYKYLGVVIDSAGNLNAAKSNMYERGQKA